MILGEALEGLVADDDIHNATLMNQAIETMIRNHPAQYLWSHKRFKTRPEGEKPFY